MGYQQNKKNIQPTDYGFRKTRKKYLIARKVSSDCTTQFPYKDDVFLLFYKYLTTWQVNKSWLEATRSLVWQETLPSLYIGSFQADFSVSFSVCGADESVLCQSLNNLDQSTGRYHTVLLEDTGCYRKPHDPSKNTKYRPMLRPIAIIASEWTGQTMCLGLCAGLVLNRLNF